jgi:hypothetical protein
MADDRDVLSDAELDQWDRIEAEGLVDREAWNLRGSRPKDPARPRARSKIGASEDKGGRRQDAAALRLQAPASRGRKARAAFTLN